MNRPAICDQGGIGCRGITIVVLCLVAEINADRGNACNNVDVNLSGDVCRFGCLPAWSQHFTDLVGSRFNELDDVTSILSSNC